MTGRRYNNNSFKNLIITINEKFSAISLVGYKYCQDDDGDDEDDDYL
jgi:hypothetical protein